MLRHPLFMFADYAAVCSFDDSKASERNCFECEGRTAAGGAEKAALGSKCGGYRPSKRNFGWVACFHYLPLTIGVHSLAYNGVSCLVWRMRFHSFEGDRAKPVFLACRFLLSGCKTMSLALRVT